MRKGIDGLAMPSKLKSTARQLGIEADDVLPIT
jgi:hypothetical protein